MNSSKSFLLAEIAVGFVLSFFIIRAFFSGKTEFEDLALGTETQSYLAVDVRRQPIHIERINGKESEDLVMGWQGRGKREATFFLGNSQTHSINQMKDGEVNMIELLHRMDKSNAREILCMSMPNAGMQEFFLAFEYWKMRLPIVVLVVPLFMDDMREDGIREVFFSELTNSKFQLRDSADELAAKVNKDLRSYWRTNPNTQTSQGDPNLAAVHETFQEKTEVYLNNKMDSASQTWNNRRNVRGHLFNWFYKLRNSVFGIKASSVRKMIMPRYNKNMEYLTKLVGAALSAKVKILIYVPPIRSDVGLPYDLHEYSSFKKAVQLIAGQHADSVFYRDFETIVPGKYWGYKEATNLSGDREMDYMHFQFEGHRILADSLQATLQFIHREDQ